jgi:hypothetical protein
MEPAPPYNSFNDKTGEKTATEHHEPDLAETGGRRSSVALNIVQNPLKVSRPWGIPHGETRQY